MSVRYVDLWLARPTRRQLGGYNFATLVTTFFFFVMVFLSAGILSALGSAGEAFTYILLWLFALETLRLYRDAMGIAKPVLPRDYEVARGVIPLMLGIVAVLGPLWLYGGATTGRLWAATGSFSDNTVLFTVEVLVVATVEEFYFRYVLTIQWGGILPQIFFAISHPSVRNILLSDPGSAVQPFIYFLAFGLLFQQLVFMGQGQLGAGRWYSMYFGLLFTTGMHGAFNTAVILFPNLRILGIKLSTFSVLGTDLGPDTAGWLLLLTLAVFVLLFHLLQFLRRRVRNHG